jgi:hypothetical protein
VCAFGVYLWNYAVSDIVEYVELMGINVQVTGGLVTLNNILGSVYIAGALCPSNRRISYFK